MVQQGGVSIEGEKIADINATITLNHFNNGAIMIKKGKKVYHQVKID